MKNLDYKKISLVLLILVILAIIPHFCNNTDRLQGQYDILKKQLSEQKQIVKETEEKRLQEKLEMGDRRDERREDKYEDKYEENRMEE